jgi:hypothetical protein
MSVTGNSQLGARSEASNPVAAHGAERSRSTYSNAPPHDLASVPHDGLTVRAGDGADEVPERDQGIIVTGQSAQVVTVEDGEATGDAELPRALPSETGPCNSTSSASRRASARVEAAHHLPCVGDLAGPENGPALSPSTDKQPSSSVADLKRGGEATLTPTSPPSEPREQVGLRSISAWPDLPEGLDRRPSRISAGSSI